MMDDHPADDRPARSLFEVLEALVSSGADVSKARSILRERFGTTCAVLVFDACGFTRITRSHGITHYLVRLVETRKLATPVLERFGCLAWRTEADNIYARFPDALSAFRAALQVVETLSAAPPGPGNALPGTRGGGLRLSAGIGYGDLLCCPLHGAFGDEMNLASKLGEDIAGPGEILLTPASWSSLPPEERGRFAARSVAICGIQLEHYLYTG